MNEFALLALFFFLVGFFSELQTALQSYSIAIQLWSLARSKCKIILHFLLKDLEKLAHFQEVSCWMQQYEITEYQIQEILDQIRTQISKT